MRQPGWQHSDVWNHRITLNGSTNRMDMEASVPRHCHLQQELPAGINPSSSQPPVTAGRLKAKIRAYLRWMATVGDGGRSVLVLHVTGMNRYGKWYYVLSNPFEICRLRAAVRCSTRVWCIYLLEWFLWYNLWYIPPLGTCQTWMFAMND